MAKKSKNDQDATAPPPHIPNRDLMQRMSFLYQASVHLQSASSHTPANSSAKSELQRLSRKHVKTMKGIASGAVVKIDPTVKRVLCKGCNTVLVPGSTSSVRVKPSAPHGKIISYTCLSCRAVRVIPAPPTKNKTEAHVHEHASAPQRPRTRIQATHADTSSSRDEPDTNNPDSIHLDMSAELQDRGQVQDQEQAQARDQSHSSAPITQTSTSTARPPPHPRRKSKIRPAPFFARQDAGHVLYRGSERVDPS
ncbi:Rpr2-domain-containing protein [Ceratobasidium sp. AG-I]|nr:Rpr2-domain-containing protein [Ceratobasidium sp. AG-I]